MPRLSAFSYALMSAFAFGSASLASAADGNSYRAGQIYLKVNAPAPGACALQCEGDAQCKSWNYVPTTHYGGVCEFNANFAQSQPHPFAISGVNDAGGYRSTQIISGATRTTRIGQPVTIRANTQAPLKAPRRVASAMQTQPQTAKPPVITRQRSFAPRQAAAPQAPQTAARNIPAQARIAPPRVNSRIAQQPQRRPAPYPAPPSERELAAQRAALQASQRARARTIPATSRTPLAAVPGPSPAPAQAPTPTSPQGYPQAPQNFEAAARASLYGGLYDDVAAKPKAAPQPLYSERPTDNPDAPIATSPYAKPVTPVDVLPLAGAASQ